MCACVCDNGFKVLSDVNYITRPVHTPAFFWDQLQYSLVNKGECEHEEVYSSYSNGESKVGNKD